MKMRTRFGASLAMLLVLGVPARPQAATPETQMGAALHEERVTGNLQAAIQGFRKVLTTKGVSRSLAAQAQYHIGLCYEKLGNQEARKAFESVVRNYGDQKDLAAQARSRLAAMSGPSDGGVRTRLLWDNALDVWGRASADGRYFSFVDWSSCDLAVRDLATGQNRKLTDIGGCTKAQAEVEGSAVSRDAKRVAYAFLRYKEAQKGDGLYDLMVIGMDGKNAKVLMHGGGLSYVEPYSWSVDNKWIAAGATFGDPVTRRSALMIVSPDTGEARRLDVRENQMPYNATISRDGRWVVYSTGRREESPTLIIRGLAEPSSEEVLQNNAFMMGWTPDGAGIIFSRDRGEAHDLYVLPVTNGKAVGRATQVHTSANVRQMPAGVTAQGALLYGTHNRRADAEVLPWSGEGFAAGIPTLSIPATVGVQWHLGTGAVQFSYDGRRLFAITPANTIAIREMPSGGARTIAPQLKAWSGVRWAHDGASLLVLGTGVDGKLGVYRIDDTTGQATILTQLQGPVRAFTPSRDGKTIYYGTPSKAQARDLATGTDKTLYESAAVGQYDLRVSHDGTRLAIRNGNIAVVDLRTGQVREIYHTPEQSAIGIWAMDWSADDRQLHTVVRPGFGLEKMESWIFPVDGGEPKRIAIPKEMRGISFSPDGKHVATSRVTQRFQLWALENFLPAKK